MFIVLVSYRAIGIQSFRRNQLIKAINNYETYFEQNKIEYKIVISEQNNDAKFNRGLLLNAAFLESEKTFVFPKKYIHMNTDYLFNLSRKFPQELLVLSFGFIDLHRPPFPVLGAACVFDGESYNKINGFPNDLEGWGGDDWAIYNRIIRNSIPLHTPKGLFNSNFIHEENVLFGNDESNNQKNREYANRDDCAYNGLNSIKYKIDGFGEFHNGKNIFHNLIGTSFVSHRF